MKKVGMVKSKPISAVEKVEPIEEIEEEEEEEPIKEPVKKRSLKKSCCTKI
jgi:hypothetical protein